MPSLSAAPSLDVSGFLPGPTDRAAFFGQSGSGKTTLERLLASTPQAARQWPLIVCYDTKGIRPWPGFRTYRRIRDVPRHAPRNEARIFYRPVPEEHPEVDPRAAEIFFRWVFLHRRGVLLIVDEAYFVAQRGRFPFHLFANITQGRELGIAVWIGSQRPALVPRIAYTEANSFFTFRLQEKDDRKRVMSLAGLPDIDENALARLPFHEFYHYRSGTEAITGPYRVNLKEG